MAPLVTPQMLRDHIEDFATTNMPLYEETLTDAELSTCIDYALDDFNETPPIFWVPYTLENFPHRKILLDGAAVEALARTAKKELRGEMQYSDGGVQNALYYKSPQFTNLMQDLRQDYEHRKLRIKRQINMTGCYGGVD